MLRSIFAFFESRFVLGPFFMLFGLSVVWIGIAKIRALRSPLPDGVAVPRSRFAAAMWTWLGMTVEGLAFFLVGLTTLRYAKGPSVDVPAGAPLIDRIVWVLFFVCGVGGFVMLYVGAWANKMLNIRARREHTDEP